LDGFILGWVIKILFNQKKERFGAEDYLDELRPEIEDKKRTKINYVVNHSQGHQRDYDTLKEYLDKLVPPDILSDTKKHQWIDSMYQYNPPHHVHADGIHKGGGPKRGQKDRAVTQLHQELIDAQKVYDERAKRGFNPSPSSNNPFNNNLNYESLNVKQLRTLVHEKHIMSVRSGEPVLTSQALRPDLLNHIKNYEGSDFDITNIDSPSLYRNNNSTPPLQTPRRSSFFK
jgi:hypothetical protein